MYYFCVIALLVGVQGCRKEPMAKVPPKQDCNDPSCGCDTKCDCSAKCPCKCNAVEERAYAP